MSRETTYAAMIGIAGELDAAVLKAHDGLNAEKLAELGIQPFRGHRRRTSSGLPPPGAPTPILQIARPADATRSAI